MIQAVLFSFLITLLAIMIHILYNYIYPRCPICGADLIVYDDKPEHDYCPNKCRW